METRTLQVSHGRRDEILLKLCVLELLEDVALDGLDELGLLRLPDGLLVSDPRIKHRLGLGGERGLLSERKVLGLELSSFLPVPTKRKENFQLSVSFE